MTRYSRTALAATLIVLACQWTGRAEPAETGAAREYTLKAGFLINFAQFATWPQRAFPEGRDRFIIGIVGDDPFGARLDEVVAGVDVSGRPIRVVRLGWGDDLRQCQMLFVTGGADQARRVVAALEGAPVLTVGDGEAFVDGGGIVAFRQENNRLRFDVNAAAARRARITLSSQMLQLARLVRQ